MKRLYLFGAILGAVAIQALCLTTIAQEPYKIVEDTARTVTVKIEYPGNTNSSGVLIDQTREMGDEYKYKVLTAAHTIKPQFSIITFDAGKYKPKNIELYNCKDKNTRHFSCKDLDLDLATVEFTSKNNYHIAKIGDSGKITSGTSIYAAGFPTIPSGPPEYRVGDIVKPGNFYFLPRGKLLANTQKQLVYTNRTLNGMSGGPLLNQAGDLVGVHTGINKASKPLGDINGQNMSIIFRKNRSLGIPIESYLKSSERKQRQSANKKPDDGYVEAVKKLDEAAAKEDKKGLKKVIQDFSKLIKFYPKYAAAYLGRAEAQMTYAKILKEKEEKEEKKNNYEKAIKDYDQAIEKDSKDDAYYYSERGNIYLALDKYNEAIKDFREALKIQKDDSVVYNGLGYAYIELKKYELAIEELNKAIKLEPNINSPDRFRVRSSPKSAVI